MDNPFKEYIETVQELVALEEKSELASYISESNIEAVFVRHDNWNGEIEFYDIAICVPIKVFARIKSNISDEEQTIRNAFNDAMRGADDSIRLNDVRIVPSKLASVSHVPIADDESMWRYNYYRLFISHLTKDKIRASYIKEILSPYGIDCFVAHEDISPSKEWQTVIENALSSTDALCAILSPNFIKSQWCDQEVGFALGRRKLVIPISCGVIPYGFIGKWQAIKSDGKSRNQVANDVFKAICTNEITRRGYLEKLVNLIVGAKSKEEALQFLNVLKDIKDIEKRYVDILYSHYTDNLILMGNECLKVANPIFEQNSLDTIKRKSPIETPVPQNIDLPF